MGGVGDNGWSITGTGVDDGDDLIDGFGDVPADASPIANLALNLSSNVVRDRAAAADSLGEDGLMPGLAGRCAISVLRKLLSAPSAREAEVGKVGGRALVASMDPRIEPSSVVVS